MLSLKKTALAVVTLASSSVYAGTMGPVCTADNVTVPCESTAWDVGVQALYLKPNYNHILGLMGGTINTTGDATTRNLAPREINSDPEWSWGFKLEGSYHFATGNDLNLNWYHLGKKTTTNAFTGLMVEPGTGEATRANTYAITPRWDAVNLEFGQHVDFGAVKNIRFHAGVQYARISTDINRTGEVLGEVQVLVDGDFQPVDTFSPYTATQSNKFTGFGPRIGADMAYDLGHGLAMYANGATAMLLGSSKLNLSYVDELGLFLPEIEELASLSGSRQSIVPEIEAKLGLNYTHALAQGNLTLDVGYMWVNYFDAQRFGADLPDSNFYLHGPYAGLKWVGSVA